MNIQDYQNAISLLSPELWLVAAIIVSALWNLFLPKAKEWTPVWCLIGLLFSAEQFWLQLSLAPTALFGNPGPFLLDKLTVGFGLLTCLIGLIVVLMTMGYEHQFG